MSSNGAELEFLKQQEKDRKKGDAESESDAGCKLYVDVHPVLQSSISQDG